MIALDTTAIIDLFKGVEDLKRKLTSMREPLCATRMSYVELMFGIDPENKKHLDEERYYDEFFQTIKVFELDADAAKTASRTHWSLKQDGQEIDETDCLIAAILTNQGVKRIITRNKKRFERIPGMNVMEY